MEGRWESWKIERDVMSKMEQEKQQAKRRLQEKQKEYLSKRLVIAKEGEQGGYETGWYEKRLQNLTDEVKGLHKQQTTQNEELMDYEKEETSVKTKETSSQWMKAGSTSLAPARQK